MCPILSYQNIATLTPVYLFYTKLLDGQKVGHFLITIQKSFKLIINRLWT